MTAIRKVNKLTGIMKYRLGKFIDTNQVELGKLSIHEACKKAAAELGVHITEANLRSEILIIGAKIEFKKAKRHLRSLGNVPVGNTHVSRSTRYIAMKLALLLRSLDEPHDEVLWSIANDSAPRDSDLAELNIPFQLNG